MRLWSLDPKYLDRAGLLAVWRESLLAKKVLAGKTKGYKNHPQLERFKNSLDSLNQINYYLFGILKEAESRNYHFNKKKIDPLKAIKKRIKVSSGQLIYEFEHLLKKLKIRDKKRYQELKKIKKAKAHFLFSVVPGKIAKWEKIK